MITTRNMRTYRQPTPANPAAMAITTRDIRPGRTYRQTATDNSSPAGTLTDGEWASQPCFIIGGGPSLKEFNFERLRGAGRIIAINRAFEFVPFADIVFFMDEPYYQDILRGKFGPEVVRRWQSFWGRKVFLNLSAYQMPVDIISVPSLGFYGPLRPIREGLYHGNNSGAGAIGLACCLGANPIYLLGFDCQGMHFHDGYGKETGDRINKIFADSFNELAKYVSTNHRIINLNPQSASKAFPFGDIDRILPVQTSAGNRVTVITPTGDRPLAFALCQQWMKNQTQKPGQWIVVDDGKTPLTPTGAMQYIRREPRPDDPQHTLIVNLKAAFPLIEGDKIIIMEDDEYYAPAYIEEMSRRLDSHEIVGIMRAKYYHLPTGGYLQIANRTHASLAETAFRKSFLPEIETLWPGDTSLDMRIWQRAGARGSLFADDARPLYLGVKGLPGRGGIGAGHNPGLYGRRDSADRTMLKQWVPKDCQIYLDILNGKLTNENYRSYFQIDLPITGITVCQNTKDLIERAYNSVRKFHPEMPIIIIDGSDSADPCAAYARALASDMTTIIPLGYNIGHGRGMCMGIDKAKTAYALIFDSDIEMLKSPVRAMFEMMEEDTFGVGYIEEKTAFDGFEWGWPGHNTPGQWMPYLHPMFQLIDIRNYRKFYPYVHHGAPCYLTMLDVYKRGLSGKILKQFPGMGHSSGKGLNWTGIPREHIRHDPGSTIKARTGKNARAIEGGWIMNAGLV